MPRPKNHLSDMEIDEISTVDKTANQYSRFVISKRAPEEEEMPKLYNQEGKPLDEDQLEFGDIVYDDAGQAYEYVEDDGTGDQPEDKEEDQPVPELAGVGKSAFFEKSEKQQAGSFSAAVMEELSKAFSDKDRDSVIAKALGRVEELETALEENTRIAKSERDLRLTREYISKAQEYNLPIPAEELGPVLYRMAETMGGLPWDDGSRSQREGDQGQWPLAPSPEDRSPAVSWTSWRSKGSRWATTPSPWCPTGGRGSRTSPGPPSPRGSLCRPVQQPSRPLVGRWATVSPSGDWPTRWSTPASPGSRRRRWLTG